MSNQLTGLLSPYLYRKRAQAARPYLTGRVLDFGCGPGHLCKFFSPENYIGMDRDEETIKFASQLYPQHSFVIEFPENEKFDHIVALAVIEHLPEPAAVLKKFVAVLTSGSLIIITTPHPNSDWVHGWGAKFGLFSREGHREHERLYDRLAMEKMIAPLGLTLELYRRFLWGQNQLFVFKKK